MTKMIRYFTTLVFISMLMCQSLSAQEEVTGYKNALKINFLSALFKTTTLNYERSTGSHSSFAIGYGRKHSGSLPGLFNQETSNLKLTQSELTGHFFNIDYRWYLNNCEGERTMTGFYIGPYLKYNRYKMDFDMEFDDGVEDFENSGNARFLEYGVGVSIGYQLQIWDRMVIDFIFFGPRTARFDVELEFEEELTEDFANAVVDKINNTVDQIFMKGGIDPEFNLKEINSDFNWFSFRYAISVGVAF